MYSLSLIILFIYAHLLQLSDDIDFVRVAREASGFSGSDVKEICRLAVLRRAKDLVDEGVSMSVGFFSRFSTLKHVKLDDCE